MIKPRAYGEPIHEDAPGFNPTIHKDLVTEMNEELTRVATRYLIGPQDGSSDQYDYRQRGDEVQFYDRTLGIWRALARVPGVIPTWQAPVTVTNTTPVARLLRVQSTITTAAARADGADFRAYAADGSRLPCRVTGVASAGGGQNTYSLVTLYQLNSGATATFNVAWGDPNANPPTFTAQEFADLSTPPTGSLGPYTVAQDPTLAYKPSDYATAGTQLYGAREDVPGTFTIPNGGSVMWNGVSYTTVGLNSNGALEFGGASAGRPTPVADAITWGGNGDLYESWVRFVTLQDGYAWHVLTGNGGYSANFKLTLRYYHGGRWTLTLLHNTSSWPSQFGVKIAGHLTTYTSQVPVTETGAPFVVDLSTGLVTSTTGANVQSGALRTDAGLLPIRTDMVYSPSGNLQTQLQNLTDRIAALEGAP